MKRVIIRTLVAWAEGAVDAGLLTTPLPWWSAVALAVGVLVVRLGVSVWRACVRTCRRACHARRDPQESMTD